MTLADPKNSWSGFDLTRYSLDTEKVLALPVIERREGKKDETPTTIEAVLSRYRDQRIQIDDVTVGVEIKSDTESTFFKGPSFNLVLLFQLLTLYQQGQPPFQTDWFFYDHDIDMTMPQEVYRFFVVGGDRIVREEVHFRDYPGSGFNPSVFDSYDDPASKQKSERGWNDAIVRFWYNKFYRETKAGQLMLLRSDKPEIYRDCESPPNTAKQLLMTNRLLWVLIFLMGLVLLRLWK